MRIDEDFIKYVDKWMSMYEESTMSYSEEVTVRLIINNTPPGIRNMLRTARCSTYADLFARDPALQGLLNNDLLGLYLTKGGTRTYISLQIIKTHCEKFSN